MKFCSDCRFRIPADFESANNQAKYAMCARTAKDTYAVTGAKVELGDCAEMCVNERYGNWLEARLFRKCGRAARFFERTQSATKGLFDK